MAPATKVAEFRREGNDWFCYAGLPSDVVVTVGGVNFHLHKFPLIYRSGKMVKQFEESHEGRRNSVILDEFPGDAETFLIAAKFCYGLRIELTPRNVVMVHCAADYLEMIDEYGEDNLFSKCESYLHKNIFRSWKECMLALQSSEPIKRWAEKLQIVSKCCDAISTMVCTDPSLFGWPMMMYGSLQSPGGSILWNGINTGARIRSVESKWWYEDISYLSIDLFVKLINTMESRGIRPENIAGAIMYYARRYLPGLGRWHGVHSGISRTVASFSMTPASVDQRVFLESIVKLLPQKKSKSYCRFLLGLLRVGLILDINKKCRDSLEGRIGMQLELATLDSLLIPSYSDSDTLYDTDCIQRIIQHFLSSEQSSTLFSPTSLEIEASPSSEPSRQVAKLVDSYIAEVASDVNLKPEKIQALAKALPEASRSLHDGLYRALDIFLKAHPWLSDRDKEQLCNIIDYQKLSIDACAHASQNERLPLRVVLQVLFFEQMQLRTALAGCLHVVDAESVPGDAITVQNDMAGHIIHKDRPSPLGPHGKPQAVGGEDAAPKIQEQQSATELLSLGSRPLEVNSVEDGEEVDQAAGSPGIHSRSPVTAPLGIPRNVKGMRKVLVTGSSPSFCMETCLRNRELPDTTSLKKRLEQKFEKEGMKISLDSMNLLNNGLDVFLKRLMKPSMELASSQSANRQQNQVVIQTMHGVNGTRPVRYIQREARSYTASMLDFRTAMELNPTILGEDWPLQLEKVYTQELEEWS